MISRCVCFCMFAFHNLFYNEFNLGIDFEWGITNNYKEKFSDLCFAFCCPLWSQSLIFTFLSCGYFPGWFGSRPLYSRQQNSIKVKYLKHCMPTYYQNSWNRPIFWEKSDNHHQLHWIPSTLGMKNGFTKFANYVVQKFQGKQDSSAGSKRRLRTWTGSKGKAVRDPGSPNHSSYKVQSTTITDTTQHKYDCVRFRRPCSLFEFWRRRSSSKRRKQKSFDPTFQNPSVWQHETFRWDDWCPWISQTHRLDCNETWQWGSLRRSQFLTEHSFVFLSGLTELDGNRSSAPKRA